MGDQRFSHRTAGSSDRAHPVLLYGSYPCTAWAVARARDSAAAAAAQAGGDRFTVAAVRLAVSEACTNVLRHAYAEASGSGFVLTCTRHSDGLRVTIADAGTGLAPLAPHRGLGLGLPIIAALADSYAVTRGERGGTKVTMTFGGAAG